MRSFLKPLNHSSLLGLLGRRWLYIWSCTFWWCQILGFRSLCMYLNEIHYFTDSKYQVIFGCLIVHKPFGLSVSVTFFRVSKVLFLWYHCHCPCVDSSCSFWSKPTFYSHQTLISLSQLSLVPMVAGPGAYGTFSGCWNGFSMLDQVLIHKENVVCFDLCWSWNEMWFELFWWLTLTFVILVLYLQFVNFRRH